MIASSLLRSFSGEATSLIFNWWSRIIPLKCVFVLSWQPRRRIIVPFHLWTLSLSLSLSLCKNEQLYIATGQVLRDRRSKEPVSGGEWANGRGGEIWNCCYTNRMGAADFQFGQISCAIFLNITKTNYPGPWCMFLLLWKTIKLCKWLMPFHTARFSLWISKVFFPFSLCLKQLYSKNLLDAFPVNPLSMFLYKQVFERTRGWGGVISKQTANERQGWVEEHGLWLSQHREFVTLFSYTEHKEREAESYRGYGWRSLAPSPRFYTLFIYYLLS